MAIQIAESDLREERGRLLFRQKVWPWQVIEFDGKFPALDAFVHVFEQSGAHAVAGRQPLTFLVQHKSKKLRDGGASIAFLDKIKVEHLDYWLSLPVPVLLTMYRDFGGSREDDILFRWVSQELRTETQRDGDTMRVRFTDGNAIGEQAKAGIVDYLKQWYGTPPTPSSAIAEAKPSRDTIVLRPGLDLVYYSNAGFDTPEQWTRFRFEPSFFGESAVLLHAHGQEDVGVNIHNDARCGTAEIQYCAPMGSGLNLRFEVIPIRRRDRIGDTSVYDELPGSVGVNLTQSSTWQTAQIAFDFRHLDELRLIVLAPRINERVRERGPGLLAVHSVTVVQT